jgi:hypothetical protein
VELSRDLDVFLACAIAGVLGIRFFLTLTGSNGTLHISHAICSRAMMLTALVAAIAFVAPSARGFVAVRGGTGSGASSTSSARSSRARSTTSLA